MAQEPGPFGSRKLTAGTFAVTNTTKNPVTRLGATFPPIKGEETTTVEVEASGPRDHIQLRACRALEVKPAGAGSSTPDTVDDILAAVGDDPAAATEALEAEQATSKPRKTLVAQLEAIVDGAGS